MGADPTHIDSHQHVHTREPVRSVVVDAAHRLGVPLRGCTPEVRYCGDFYGQSAEGTPFPDGISVTRLLEMLAALPSGITELACHPGEGNDLQTMYSQERSQEVQTLCHPRVREALIETGIALSSFHAVCKRAVSALESSFSGCCRDMAQIECKA
jgi:predicted glycoside hydrolase/deacetylase ChbG (UPF0249 family)